MKQLPDYLKPFQEEAERYVREGLVREIEFSGPTYQIQLFEPETDRDFWTFLQLDNKGDIKDCFCSIEEEDVTYCVHLAAAFLKIYNEHDIPLHHRFEQSLWNKLCALYADRLGVSASILKKEGEGSYAFSSISGKLMFAVEAKTESCASLLHEIIEDRNQQTEETSLKFSNLSEEEIDLWKMGKPSEQLKFELSFWNDLAHLLMKKQENREPYTIKFEYAETLLPNRILISFDDLHLNFYLSEANLPLIVPALNTVDSPLSVNYVSEIEKFAYDKKNRILTLFSKKQKKGEDRDLVKGIAIKGWGFIPKKGFYSTDESSAAEVRQIKEDEIPAALNQYADLMQKLLVGDKLQKEPLQLNYQIHFNKAWDLIVESYAFVPGDLEKPYSRLFDNWIYVDGEGFFPLGSNGFKKVRIPEKEVSDFIWEHKNWLYLQSGFQPHLKTMDQEISYEVTEKNELKFTRKLSVEEDTQAKAKDFGPWVYVPEEGFYLKKAKISLLPTDEIIKSEMISNFIDLYNDELEFVPKFFSKGSPFKEVELQITINKDSSISTEPLYKWLDAYQTKNVKVFDEYTFVEGEGFHPLPLEQTLPFPYNFPHHIEPKDVPHFISHDLEELKSFLPKIDYRLIAPKNLQLVATKISQDAKEYRLNLVYRSQWGEVSIADLRKAIEKKKKFLFSKAGFIDLHDPRFRWIKNLQNQQIEKSTGDVLLSTMELIRLNVLDELNIKPKNPKDYSSKELLQALLNFEVPKEPVLTGLKSPLREYQQIGVKWLWFLYSHQLSGLLCDEMGLGKTHQAMGLFAAILNDDKQKGERDPLGYRHFLIVCPTSVLYHWEEKLKEFFPELRICVFHGTSRELSHFHEQYDLLLTSYGIWRLEHKQLSKMPFEVAVFDEIQIAKNHNSRLNVSLREINAKMRLGLTGTPIENKLRELKSLFDIVLPNYMPPDAEYREQFIRPIEREEDPKRRALLTRFTKPFVLRRKKSDVLKDLPEKTEEISHCDLTSEQKDLYQQVLLGNRARLLEQLQDESSAIPYMHIFSILSSLKQICDHPAVFLKKPDQFKEYTSGKWDLFIELLEEARESQQKVVVFSQYLFMLDIIEQYLQEQNIKYATIRGATTKRGQQVNLFNKDPKCEVFVGSLQAAGLGVDLTAGSVVIHYDRWWNAARENQATDRVHRFGQTRGVQVFKLVTKGTFEERIDEIIRNKARLMEEVVTADDHRFMKLFDRNELIQLLQDVEEMGGA